VVHDVAVVLQRLKDHVVEGKLLLWRGHVEEGVHVVEGKLLWRGHVEEGVLAREAMAPAAPKTSIMPDLMAPDLAQLR
jgi:hypothetical protein